MQNITIFYEIFKLIIQKSHKHKIYAIISDSCDKLQIKITWKFI